MRIAFFSFLVALFFLGMTYYFFVEVSPFNEAKLDEIIQANNIKPNEEDKLYFELEFIIERGLVLEYLSENAYVGLLSLVMCISILFFSLNLVIDKFFFKTLFEPPDYFLAFRRGVEFSLASFAFLSMKLRGIDIQVAILSFVIALGIDVFLESIRKSKQKELQDHFPKPQVEG